MIDEELQGHVLDFDQVAAERAGQISAELHAVGRRVEIRDVQIAGIVAARHATLATRNVKHFADTGISIVDPWEKTSAKK
ncbi:MAG: hypothetical protein SGI77_15550 [Pirellulaceae bacterium]|nr:hypothetical protein [Pirellulaceae bacterium]